MTQNRSETSGSVSRSQGPLGVLVSLWLLGFFVTAFQIVPASVLPIAMEELVIGPVAASWLVSASLAAQAIGNIPVGIAIDRTSNRIILTIAAVAMLVAGVWGWIAATSGTYWPLVGAIALGGAAIAAVITGGANLIGGVFSSERRATAVAIFTTSAPSGYALGQFSGPIIATAVGWESVFLVFGLLAGAAVVLLWFVGEGIEADTERSSPPTMTDFKRLLVNHRVWIVCTLSFTAYSLYLFYNTWMPTYISENFGLSLSRSGLYAALFPVIGIAARAGGGFVSDRVFEHNRRPVALVAFVVSVPLVGAVASVTVPIVLVLLLVPAGFFVQLGIGLFYTYVREVVHSSVTGTALAMLGLISFVGAFTTPVITGTLIEYSETYLLAFGYAGVLAVVGVVLAFVAPEPNT